ncbi:GNAT family N-acetyltransferase [Chitinimonas arctica]|nr:GNAT family N-acetyltransferase [Chitinimonas arctica]
MMQRMIATNPYALMASGSNHSEVLVNRSEEVSNASVIDVDRNLKPYTNSLVTANLFLRPIFPSDYRGLLPIFTNPEAVKYFMSGRVMTVEELQQKTSHRAMVSADVHRPGRRVTDLHSWAMITHDGMVGYCMVEARLLDDPALLESVKGIFNNRAALDLLDKPENAALKKNAAKIRKKNGAAPKEVPGVELDWPMQLQLRYADYMELSYAISPASSGRGLTTEACKAVINHVGGKYYATVHPLNIPSQRVLEKSGLDKVQDNIVVDRYVSSCQQGQSRRHFYILDTGRKNEYANL